MKVKCPTCEKPVEWTEAEKFRPFCSDRCRLIDLGEWFSEEKRIPADQAPAAESSSLPPDWTVISNDNPDSDY